jgi:hypothetical protein
VQREVGVLDQDRRPEVPADAVLDVRPDQEVLAVEPVQRRAEHAGEEPEPGEVVDRADGVREPADPRGRELEREGQRALREVVPVVVVAEELGDRGDGVGADVGVVVEVVDVGVGGVLAPPAPPLERVLVRPRLVAGAVQGGVGERHDGDPHPAVGAVTLLQHPEGAPPAGGIGRVGGELVDDDLGHEVVEVPWRVSQDRVDDAGQRRQRVLAADGRHQEDHPPAGPEREPRQAHPLVTHGGDHPAHRDRQVQ